MKYLITVAQTCSMNYLIEANSEQEARTILDKRGYGKDDEELEGEADILAIMDVSLWHQDRLDDEGIPYITI